MLREDSASGEELLAVAYAVFGATLEELVAARGREGERLRELLEQRCTGLEALVRRRARAACRRCRRACGTRLERARWRSWRAASTRSAWSRNWRCLLQRLDVDEELERLSGHIDEVRRVHPLAASRPAAASTS